MMVYGRINNHKQYFMKIDKPDEIIAVKDRLQKYCLSKGLLFVDNRNIDASCLNRGKLHLNRQGTLILADNFRKSLVNSEPSLI